MSYLDVIALVVVTAFAEKSVMYNTVDVELVEKRITVLCLLALDFPKEDPMGHTFETEAVNTTTS